MAVFDAHAGEERELRDQAGQGSSRGPAAEGPPVSARGGTDDPLEVLAQRGATHPALVGDQFHVEIGGL
jgi:hypothetical protein